MKNSDIGFTLKKLRNDSKLSVLDVVAKLKDFNQDISVKTLYSYENGTRAASADMLLALCQIYNCTNVLEVFSNVEVDYSIPTDAEWGILEKYRDTDTYGQEIVSYILKREYDRTQAQTKLQKELKLLREQLVKNSVTPQVFRMLTYCYGSSSAGSGIYILGNEGSTQIEVPVNDLTDRADYALRVNGDSMEPFYCDGDKVLVSQREVVDIGDVGIFVKNNESFIKERGETELISANEDYPNVIVSENDNICCLGKVIGKLED